MEPAQTVEEPPAAEAAEKPCQEGKHAVFVWTEAGEFTIKKECR
jgi:hypothetical protein